ncbi:MAG: diguanylate cyclase [Betaproteobacteria bacterium]|nr:diguanylate cyclase [Betaproteobacteria bacterium]
MNSPHRRHDPFLVQWLILLAALSVLGIAVGFDLYQEHGRVERREQERLLAIARVIEENVEQNLVSVNRVLADLRKEAMAAPDGAKFNERLATLVEAMPSVRTISVLGTGGRILATSRPELFDNKLDFSRRDYFTAPQRQPNPDILFVSPPFRTALGVFAINVTRMVPGPRGEFAGVVTATLDPKYFDPLLDSVRYAQDMAASLLHGDGIVFVHAPREQAVPVGRNLDQPSSFFRRHRDSGQASSVFAGVLAATGEERMIAQYTVQPADLNMDKPLGVAVSRRVGDIYASWERDLRVKAVWFALSALVFVLGLHAYQRRLREFVRQEAEATRMLQASERFMKTVADNIPGMVAYWTSDLRCAFANSAYLEWYGKTAEQMRDVRFQDLMGDELFGKSEPRIRAALRGERQDFECTLTRADGSTGHAWVHYVPDLDGDRVKGFFVMVSDISQFKRIELALAESEAKLKAIIDAEPECVKMLAPDGTLQQMNRAGLDMIEAESEQQVLGAKVVDLVVPEHKATFNALNEKIGRGEAGSLEFEIIGLKGRRRWLDTHAVPMRDADGRITGLLGVTRDISARKKALQELERLSQIDALTGLANRRHFMALAEQELARAIRYGGALSLFMMDIDHFKGVNDTYGHQTGDLVLQQLGNLCRETLREIDSVGRIGGEEFAVILPQTDAAQALDVAERLRLAVAGTEVALEHGLPLHFTLSIGVTTLAGGGANIDMLLGQADSALYEAKRTGRNRVCAHQGSR